MELLIPGLILVALMVWASTKIKKTAAAAYEQETVSTAEFTIVKPDGFIIPVSDESPYLFEARTKEYETLRKESIPQVSAVVTKHVGETFESVCEGIKVAAARVTSEDVHREGSRVCVIEAEEAENGVTYATRFKILESTGEILVLRLRAVGEQSDDTSRKIDEMVRSFAVS
jgi:glycerol-3-phosphate dehydrogenase